MKRNHPAGRHAIAAQLLGLSLASAAIAASGPTGDDNSWANAWAAPQRASGGVSGGVSPEGENLSPIADPEGDAVAVFGADPPLIDIDTISVSYTDTDLLVSITFFTPIAPPSAALPESVGGFVEFDCDQDAATGLPPVQNIYSPPFDMLVAGNWPRLKLGSEYFHPGLFDVETPDGVIGQVPAVFGDKSVSAVIPLAMLDDDGLLDLDVSVGTVLQPTDATDVVGTSVPASGCDCVADCTGDCRLDILDFVCFQNLFVGGDPAADCDGDGVLNILDFVCFQNAFTNGCQ